MFHLATARTKGNGSQSTNRSTSESCHKVGNREPSTTSRPRGLRSGGQMQLANRGPTLADTALLRVTNGDYLHRHSRSSYINAKPQSCMFILRFTQNLTHIEGPIEETQPCRLTGL